MNRPSRVGILSCHWPASVALGQRRPQFKLKALSILLNDRIGILARQLVGAEPTMKSGDEWRFRAKGSLSVIVCGPRRGVFFDFEAGKGGDALALVAHLRHVSIQEAASWVLDWLGEAVGADETSPSTKARRSPETLSSASTTENLAQNLWREAVPAEAESSLVPLYLHARGLDLPAGAPLRFHPNAWRTSVHGPHGPAMLALMTDTGGNAPCGVHVTYLQTDGSGKAAGGRPKVMLGKCGVVRLVPDDEVTMGLGLAEGIETSLAVMQRAGWRPVWAATSSGSIRKFPLLQGIQCLTIFADADRPGLDAARACCGRWKAAGREARILAPPSGDWDDVLPRRYSTDGAP